LSIQLGTFISILRILIKLLFTE